MDGHDGRQRSISFEVSVQTTVSKLHMELDRPAHWRTEPGGGEPRTLTSGAPIPEPAARPAATQPRSPARYATHQKLEFLRFKTKVGTLTIRRSGMLRSSNRASRRFDTFAVTNFLRLARSCRVVEKFDKNHRFLVIFCDRVPRSDRSDRISPQRDKISANGEKSFRAMYWTSYLREYSV